MRVYDFVSYTDRDDTPGWRGWLREAVTNLWKRVPNEREMIHRHICSLQVKGRGVMSIDRGNGKGKSPCNRVVDVMITVKHGCLL